MYIRIIKPVLDKLLALIFVGLFWWLYIILAILVRVKLGSPVLFVQERPGKIDPKTKKEVIFKLYKFRTMTDERDAKGNLLTDEKRLMKFGSFLRSTSCDELPEILFNILLKSKNSMSWVGPRPQLVRDMVFMTDEQRKRHTVSPGLTGLAQIKGRNAITWDQKLAWDLKYIEEISFLTDVRIFFSTIRKILFGRKRSQQAETELALDYGDELLRSGEITKEKYDALQAQVKVLIEKSGVH